MGEIKINTVKIPHSWQEVFLQFCAVDGKVDFSTWIIKRIIMQNLIVDFFQVNKIRKVQ